MPQECYKPRLCLSQRRPQFSVEGLFKKGMLFAAFIASTQFYTSYSFAVLLIRFTNLEMKIKQIRKLSLTLNTSASTQNTESINLSGG